MFLLFCITRRAGCDGGRNLSGCGIERDFLFDEDEEDVEEAFLVLLQRGALDGYGCGRRGRRRRRIVDRGRPRGRRKAGIEVAEAIVVVRLGGGG